MQWLHYELRPTHFILVDFCLCSGACACACAVVLVHVVCSAFWEVSVWRTDFHRESVRKQLPLDAPSTQWPSLQNHSHPRHHHHHPHDLVLSTNEKTIWWNWNAWILSEPSAKYAKDGMMEQWHSTGIILHQCYIQWIFKLMDWRRHWKGRGPLACNQH